MQVRTRGWCFSLGLWLGLPGGSSAQWSSRCRSTLCEFMPKHGSEVPSAGLIFPTSEGSCLCTWGS